MASLFVKSKIFSVKLKIRREVKSLIIVFFVDATHQRPRLFEFVSLEEKASGTQIVQTQTGEVASDGTEISVQHSPMVSAALGSNWLIYAEAVWSW